MAMVGDVKLTDNSEAFLQAEAEQIMAALEAIGGQAEAYAKEDCPVDTGRLRNSISHATEGRTAYIGTNVEYAPEVEYRDIKHTTGRAHFLRDAATTHGDEYRTITEAALKS